VLMVLIVRELVPLGTVDPEGGRESVI